jgi:hypothetical protein
MGVAVGAGADAAPGAGCGSLLSFLLQAASKSTPRRERPSIAAHVFLFMTSVVPFLKF